MKIATHGHMPSLCLTVSGKEGRSPPPPPPSLSNKTPDRGLPSTKITRGWVGGRDFHVSSRIMRALNLLWKMRVSS